MSDTNGMFRKQCVHKVSSPDGLEDYIRVIGPGVWIATIGLTVLILSAFIWAIFGTIPVTVEETFIVKDQELISFFTQEQANLLHTGMSATANNTEVTVKSISTTPLSQQEAAALLPDDYTIHLMNLADWNIKVTLTGLTDVSEGDLVDVVIVPDAIRPIDYLLN